VTYRRLDSIANQNGFLRERSIDRVVIEFDVRNLFKLIMLSGMKWNVYNTI